MILFTSDAPKVWYGDADHTEGSILPAIFDFLYREYCRARLVEIRKQLFLIQTNSPATAEADGNVRSSDGLGDSLREDDQARRV